MWLTFHTSHGRASRRTRSGTNASCRHSRTSSRHPCALTLDVVDLDTHLPDGHAQRVPSLISATESWSVLGVVLAGYLGAAVRIPCSPPHYKDDQAIVDEDGEVDKDVAVNAIAPAVVES